MTKTTLITAPSLQQRCFALDSYPRQIKGPEQYPSTVKARRISGG